MANTSDTPSPNRAAADKCDWVVGKEIRAAQRPIGADKCDWVVSTQGAEGARSAARPSADKCDWVVVSKGAAGATRPIDQPGTDKCDWVTMGATGSQSRVAADKCDWVINPSLSKSRPPERSR